MHLFYRLLLAHIIADFPLQTNIVFNLKAYKKWGVMLHSSIVLLLSLILSIEYLVQIKVVIIIITIFITHTIIDKFKIKITKKYKNHDLFFFIIDQLLHILIIFILTFNLTQKYSFVPKTGFRLLNTLIEIYNNDIFILCLIGYFTSVYVIPILLTFVRDTKNQDNIKLTEQKTNRRYNITSNELIDKVYRLLLTIGTQFISEYYILVIFICFVLLNIIPFDINKNSMGHLFNLKRILNTSLAIFVGILLKFVYSPT